MLRALNVAPGEHKITLDFHPKTLKVTESMAYAGYAVLVVVLGVMIFLTRRKR